MICYGVYAFALNRMFKYVIIVVKWVILYGFIELIYDHWELRIWLWFYGVYIQYKGRRQGEERRRKCDIIMKN